MTQPERFGATMWERSISNFVKALKSVNRDAPFFVSVAPPLQTVIGKGVSDLTTAPRAFSSAFRDNFFSSGSFNSRSACHSMSATCRSVAVKFFDCSQRSCAPREIDCLIKPKSIKKSPLRRAGGTAGPPSEGRTRAQEPGPTFTDGAACGPKEGALAVRFS
jgi:hypothetical protein